MGLLFLPQLTYFTIVYLFRLYCLINLFGATLYWIHIFDNKVHKLYTDQKPTQPIRGWGGGLALPQNEGKGANK